MVNRVNFVQQICESCESTGLKRFPSLRRHINDVVRKFLDAAAKPAEEMIRNLIEMEVFYFLFSFLYMISTIM